MSKAEKLEAIIFDFDGTLVDSEAVTIQLANPIIKKYMGREFSEEELNYLKGKVWRNVFKKWLPEDHDKLYQEIVDNWKEKDPPLQLYPNIKDMLDSLMGGGVSLAISSSRERILIQKNLESLGISSYFEAVVGQEDTDRHKPEPDPLIMAADKMGINYNSCIYIGDQLNDVLASRSAGMLSGGAVWGEGIQSVLTSAKPDYIFHSPDEVSAQLLERVV